METGKAAVDWEHLEAARAAYRGARYDEVLRLTAGWEAAGPHLGEAIMMRANALMRRSPADTLGWLAGISDVLDDDAAHFYYETATARAYAAASNLEAAEARLAAAAGYALSVPDGAEELALQRARLHFMQRTIRPDDPDLATALHARPAIAAEAYAVRAWAQCLREDYRAMLADFRASLDLAAAHQDEVEVRVAARVVFPMARVGFETADAGATAHAADALAWIPWTEDVQNERFQTLRILGWDAYMRGEAGRAQWLFRDALQCAPSKAWETMARLDRAHVARLMRNEAWAAEELEAADRLAEDVAWSSTVGEERVVLAALAQLLAPVDLARAQRYAATYTALGTRGMDPSIGWGVDGKDRRAEAYRRYTTGSLECVAGNTEGALTALRLAFTFFDAVRYHFRAALAALDLYELTGDATWADRARQHASLYPASPLLLRLDHAVERRHPVLDLLTPFQRQLARALWEGIDDEDALSRRFSRSIYTIRRETGVVFAAFGVTNRAGLRAAAVERGLA